MGEIKSDHSKVGNCRSWNILEAGVFKMVAKNKSNENLEAIFAAEKRTRGSIIAFPLMAWL